MHAHSRRGFLRASLGACWTGAALLEPAVLRAAHARAQAATTEAGLFDIENVAEGVYAVQARPQSITNCNAAAAGRRAGKSVAELQKEITPATLASLKRGDYGSFLIKTLSASTAPGVTGAAALEAGVRTNLGHIYERLEVS